MGVLKRFRELKIRDYMALCIFPLAYIISLFFRKKNKNLILIIEDGREAKDNAYWLFKYIRENYPNQDVAYVIDYNSKDYLKVKDLGKCIEYASFKHWIYYLSANINASTQKDGKPNAAVCYFFEVVLKILKNKRVFLQHGITISDAKWLYYDSTQFRTFICGAKTEYDAIVKNFGYPKEKVEYLGFSRFDNLHEPNINKKQILLMPSWREWLIHKTDYYYEFNESTDFTKSEYYTRWNEFINSDKLIEFLEENNLELIFYPHRNLQKYLHLFNNRSNNIKFAHSAEYDIQKLLKESAVLITDFSSVFMDFAYMNKPTLYYQFDYDKFRKAQYQEGYFDYADGFGPVFYNSDDMSRIVGYLGELYNKEFEIDEKYLKKINEFFPIRDKKNSERIYNYLKGLLSE